MSCLPLTLSEHLFQLRAILTVATAELACKTLLVITNIFCEDQQKTQPVATTTVPNSTAGHLRLSLKSPRLAFTKFSKLAD